MTHREIDTHPGPAIGLPAALLVLCASAGLVAVALFWPEQKPAEPQWLGMEVESLTPDVRAALGLHPDQRGVYVSDVVGVAADAGVREGDVIVAVGQRPVTGLDSYRAAASASRAQGSAYLQVVRRGAVLAITVDTQRTPAGGQPWVPAALPPGCATCPNAAACLPPQPVAPVAFTRGCTTGTCPVR